MQGIEHRGASLMPGSGDFMADYKDTIDEWQKTVRRKARELDEKYSISDLVDEGARAAGEAAKKGAQTVSQGRRSCALKQSVSQTNDRWETRPGERLTKP